MGTLRKGLNKVLEFVCCTLLALMTIFATWQVASRYVFNNPSTVTEELVLICFVWMGLLGAAYLQLFYEIIIMVFAVLVLVFGGWNMSRLSMGQLSSSLQIPMGYIYLALPLSGVITAIYNVLNISDIIKALSSGSKKEKSKVA